MRGNIHEPLAAVVMGVCILMTLVFAAGCLWNDSQSARINQTVTVQNSLNNSITVQHAANSSKIIAVATSLTHNLALRENGTVIAWAEGHSCSRWGECDIPQMLTNVTAIGVGEGFSVALTKEGNVVVWGCKWDPPSQYMLEHFPGYYYTSCEENCPCKVPANLTRVKSISAGRRHILAVKEDGTVTAWGENNYGQCNVPVKLKNVTAGSAGGYMSMALREDGFVYTWGDYRGRVPPGAYKGIASGYYYGLLLTDNGTVRPLRGAKDFETPYEDVYVPDLTNVTALSGYDRYFLALLDNGTVVYWTKSKSSTMFKKWENITELHNITAISSQSMSNIALRDDGSVLYWELFSSNVSVRNF